MTDDKSSRTDVLFLAQTNKKWFSTICPKLADTPFVYRDGSHDVFTYTRDFIGETAV